MENLLLTKEEMTNPNIVPEWLVREYKTFHKIVTNKTFPCTFGMAGEKKGELRYSYISHDDWSTLPKTLEAFISLFDSSKPLIRHGFFLFVEPEEKEQSLEYYRQYFWNILQYLHEVDEKPWP